MWRLNGLISTQWNFLSGNMIFLYWNTPLACPVALVAQWANRWDEAPLWGYILNLCRSVTDGMDIAVDRVCSAAKTDWHDDHCLRVLHYIECSLRYIECSLCFCGSMWYSVILNSIVLTLYAVLFFLFLLHTQSTCPNFSLYSDKSTKMSYQKIL